MYTNVYFVISKLIAFACSKDFKVRMNQIEKYSSILLNIKIGIVSTNISMR